MTRRVEVELDRYKSVVRGYATRALIIAVTGNAPCWIPRLSGWSVSEQTARDVIALAETMPYVEIVITGRTDRRTDRRANARAALMAAPAPREVGELW